MEDVLWFLLSLAILVGLGWVAYKIEPHYVSKDGRRMLTSGQVLDHHGTPITRWRETKILITVDGLVIAEQKRFMRRRGSLFAVVGESDAPPRKRAVFLLRGAGDDPTLNLLALRLPVTSRGVEALRAVIQT